jgi:hypothetical protein
VSAVPGAGVPALAAGAAGVASHYGWCAAEKRGYFSRFKRVQISDHFPGDPIRVLRRRSGGRSANNFAKPLPGMESRLLFGGVEKTTLRNH